MTGGQDHPATHHIRITQRTVRKCESVGPTLPGYSDFNHVSRRSKPDFSLSTGEHQFATVTVRKHHPGPKTGFLQGWFLLKRRGNLFHASLLAPSGGLLSSASPCFCVQIRPFYALYWTRAHPDDATPLQRPYFQTRSRSPVLGLELRHLFWRT